MEVPVRGLAAIVFSPLLRVRGRASWELFLGIPFFSSSFFWFFYGFNVNVWSICSKLQTRPHLWKFTFIYILLFDFLAKCFVTIETGLNALRRIPAWASFYFWYFHAIEGPISKFFHLFSLTIKHSQVSFRFLMKPTSLSWNVSDLREIFTDLVRWKIGQEESPKKLTTHPDKCILTKSRSTY